MKLIDYIKQLPRGTRASFASRCGTTRGHLLNVAYGSKPCSPKLAAAIERESGGVVTRAELRSDYREIWPELAAA